MTQHDSTSWTLRWTECLPILPLDSWRIISVTATLTNNISTIYAVGKLLDAYSLEYSWNTKLYNFRLVRLFHSLHSIQPSLLKSCGNVATPSLFHVVLWTFTLETTATHVQLSRASSNHVVEHWASSVDLRQIILISALINGDVYIISTCKVFYNIN